MSRLIVRVRWQLRHPQRTQHLGGKSVALLRSSALHPVVLANAEDQRRCYRRRGDLGKQSKDIHDGPPELRHRRSSESTSEALLGAFERKPNLADLTINQRDVVSADAKTRNRHQGMRL
jgi:hypothetical protein